MQSHAHHTSTISFDLINPAVEKTRDLTFTNELESLAPAIAWNLALNLRIPAKSISVTFFTTLGRNAFRARFQLEMAGAKQLAVEELMANDAARLTELVKQSLKDLDTANKLRQETISISNAAAVTSVAPQLSQYRGKVQSRAYTYNQLDSTMSLQVSFLDEAAQPYTSSLKPHKTNIAYDRWSNVTGLTYEYAKCAPATADHLHTVDLVAEEAVSSNLKQWSPFLTSVKERNFNQALRRAASAGASGLVKVLFDLDAMQRLDLDINGVSESADKTAMDLALASKDQATISMLREKGAKTFAEMRLLMVDHHRDEFRKQKPTTEKFGAFGEFGTLGAAESDYDRVNRLNQENQERLRREQERFDDMARENQRHRAEFEERQRRDRLEIERLNRENQERFSSFGFKF